MMTDLQKTITVAEAGRNFTEAARLADTHGDVLVTENSKPKYRLINLEIEPDLELTDDEKIDVVARRIMKRFKPAFMELAK